jgi:hypothetical protein
MQETYPELWAGKKAMAIALEKRINKLEKAMPGRPCRKKEHSKFQVFIYGMTPERDRENDRIIESIRQCKQCGQREIVTFNHFGSYQPQIQPEPEPQFTLNISFVDFDAKTAAPEDDATKLKRILSEYRGES